MQKALQRPLIRSVSAIVAYAVLGLILYAGCLEKFFAMEDFFHIAWVERGGFGGVVSAFFSKNEYGLYRPLTIHVYFYLCRMLFDLNPVGYHFVNMVSQIANTILVFFLVSALTRDRWVGFIAGTIYITRISHFMGVFWVSGIQEVWLAFFYLLTLLLFVRFLKTGKRLFFFASIAGFLLSLLCKESAVTLPFVLLACGLLFDEQLNIETLLKRYGIFFAIMLLFVAAKTFFLTFPVGRLYEVGIGIWQFKNLLVYTIWQVNLTYLAFICMQILTEINPYSFLLREDVLWSITGVGAALLLGMLLIFRGRLHLIAGLRRSDVLTRLAAMGICFFLLGLVPALLLKNRVQHFYLFVPSAGFSMGAAAILGKCLSRRTTSFLLVLVVIAGFLGYALVDIIPDGRTSTLGKRFLEDLNNLIGKRQNIAEVYILNSNTYVYQVLWSGEAFNTFLDKPVPVVFDFQEPDFRAGENTLKVTYDGMHLREITEP